ncbi:MAG TPA: inositol monophosphatase family protein [Bacteroidota bacterium]|nr:inositol monophosphatase family protein [Bacteroidota bacterium]
MLEIAIEAALEAGKYLKTNIGNIQHVERKDGQETNLVTEIDKRSEHMIMERIQQDFPDHDFLGEETGGHNIKSEYRWIIDPLDGTVNYTHGLPYFCVSIGLEYKGTIQLGVVYDPSANELFTAERGKGAYLNHERLQVTKTNKLIESMLVTGFPYNINENPDHAIEHFTNFLAEAQAIRRLGSAALDLCYVAAGRFEGFWEVNLHPWDIAAGVLILLEAGGTWTDFHGLLTSVYNPQLLASNGTIHKEMMRVLKKAL